MSDKGAVVKRLVSELGAEIVGLRSRRGLWEIVKAIVSIVPAVVKKVEAAGVELGIKGADKKELALDVIFDLLPPLPAWVPEGIVRFYAGMVIEKAIAVINRGRGEGAAS